MKKILGVLLVTATFLLTSCATKPNNKSPQAQKVTKKSTVNKLHSQGTLGTTQATQSTKQPQGTQGTQGTEQPKSYEEMFGPEFYKTYEPPQALKGTEYEKMYNDAMNKTAELIGYDTPAGTDLRTFMKMISDPTATMAELAPKLHYAVKLASHIHDSIADGVGPGLEQKALNRKLQKAGLNDASLAGYTIIATKTIEGFYSENDVYTDGFQGCEWDRVILFTDNKILTCREYSYSYAYRPEAIILSNGYDFKMIVEGEVYDMKR